MKKGLAVIYVLVILALVGAVSFLAVSNWQLKNQIDSLATPTPTPVALSTPTPSAQVIALDPTLTPSTTISITPSASPSSKPKKTPTPTPTVKPTLTPTPIATSTPTPTPTPTLTKAEEIKLIRSLIANFEMYNAAHNTAGALQNFTSPKSEFNKLRFEFLHQTNVPYSITSWSYFDNNDNTLLVPISGGYRVYVVETRSTGMDTFNVDTVRVGNEFRIDRYYQTALGDSGLADDLKYQGFRF